jgi:predicted DNA-binding transcriptional regulator AlpA
MTELWSASEIVRRLSGCFAVRESRVRELLSRDDAPRPILIAGRKRYRRSDVEAWVERLPSIVGNETVTGTKNGPGGQDH